MGEVKKDRRESPRIDDDKISMKVRSEDTDIITRSTNISSSGIYCKSDRELPLMSRVKVTLVLPMPSKQSESSTRVEAEGVVVRGDAVTIDDKIDHYDIAIFFDNLMPKDRELINYYIARKG